MTDTQMYAWIFLSVSEKPTSLQEIIAAADWRNHAIPLQEELQTSLGWLQAQGLVRKEFKEYSLTDAGIALYKSISCGNVYEKIAKKFSKLSMIDFQPDDIAKVEIDTAYRLYSTQYKEILQKMSNKNKK